MFSFNSIYKAYKSCRKNKRNTINALEFEKDVLQNLWNLENELNSKSYKIGKSICFLASSPKLREVFASDFRDRVVHHLLVPHLEGFYEPKFIYDVYNNRKNRGIHLAIKRAQKFSKSNSYYLQLDIKGFFYSLDKNILFLKIFNDLKNSNINFKDEIIWLSNKIIYHDPTKNFTFRGDISKLKLLPPHKTLFKVPKHRGLPIGNLTSQFFANLYMNSFDNFLKRYLKVKCYLRYVDDFVIFENSMEKLLYLKKEIEKYLLNELDLKLRDDFKLKKVNDGLDFLGYIVRPEYILVRKRVVNNYKQKKAIWLNKFEKNRGFSYEEFKKFQSIQASFKGHLKFANSNRLLHKVGLIDDEKFIPKLT